MGSIAYLGSTSAFGYQAAIKEFGPSANYVSYPSHAEIYHAVVSGKACYGVMAIENVDAGIVAETVRTMVRHRFSNPESNIRICSEVTVPVNLLMMAHKESTLADINTLASHEMALLQSSTFVEQLLEKHPQIRTIRVNSTSEAAKLAYENKSLAALASPLSMHEYNLGQIHTENTENKLNNSTRFWIIGRETTEQTGIDKSCFVLHLNRDLPGAISQSLQFFAKEQINISILHPVPHPNLNYEYLFVIELEAHQDSPKMRRAIMGLNKAGIGLDMLGSYANRSTALTSIYQLKTA